MVPDRFLTFFAASLTADGALIGLLFVAIAIEPKNIFGASPQRELAANGAFTSLVNAFLISMLALVPGVTFGWAAIIVAGLSLVSTILHTLDRSRRDQRVIDGSLVHTGAALLLYGLEMFFGIQMVLQPSRSLDGLYPLIYVLVAIYGVALARAWSLLGGEDRSFRRILIRLVQRKAALPPAPPPVPGDDPTPPR